MSEVINNISSPAGENSVVREMVDDVTGKRNLFRGGDRHGEKIFEEDYIDSETVEIGGKSLLRVVFDDGSINYVSLETGSKAFHAPARTAGDPIQIAGHPVDQLVTEDGGIRLYDPSSGRYLFGGEKVERFRETEMFGRRCLMARFSTQRFNYLGLDDGREYFPEPGMISRKPVKLDGQEYLQVLFGGRENLYSSATGAAVAPSPYRAGTLVSFTDNLLLQYTEPSGALNIIGLNGKPFFKEGYQSAVAERRYGEDLVRVTFADGRVNFIRSKGRRLELFFLESMELSSAPVVFGTRTEQAPDGSVRNVPREWDLVTYPDGRQNLMDTRTGEMFFEVSQRYVSSQVFSIAGDEYVCRRTSHGLQLMDQRSRIFVLPKRCEQISGPVQLLSSSFYDVTYYDGTRNFINVVTGSPLFPVNEYLSVRQEEQGFAVMDTSGVESLIPYASLGLSADRSRIFFDLEALRSERPSPDGDEPHADAAKWREWASGITVPELQAVLKPYASGPDALGIPYADRQVLASLFADRRASADPDILREVFSLLSPVTREAVYSNAGIRSYTPDAGQRTAFVRVHPDDWFRGLSLDEQDLAIRLAFSSSDGDTLVGEDVRKAFAGLLDDARVSRIDSEAMRDFFASLPLELRRRMRDGFAAERAARFSRAIGECSAAALHDIIRAAAARGIPVHYGSAAIGRLSKSQSLSVCIDLFEVHPEPAILERVEAIAREAAGVDYIPELVCPPLPSLYTGRSADGVVKSESVKDGPYVEVRDGGGMMLCSKDGASLLAEPLERIVPAIEAGIGTAPGFFVGWDADGRCFLMDSAGVPRTDLYDHPWELQTEGRLAEEAERSKASREAVAVTVVEAAAERRRLVRRGEAVDTTAGRYSNPFQSGKKVKGRLIGSVRDSVHAYVAWLIGEDFTDYRQDQRNAILDDLLLCRLSGRSVITDSDAIPDDSYGEEEARFTFKTPSHAHYLLRFIRNPKDLLARIRRAAELRAAVSEEVGRAVKAPKAAAARPAAAPSVSVEVVETSPEGVWFAGLSNDEKKAALLGAALPAGMAADEAVLGGFADGVRSTRGAAAHHEESQLTRIFYSLSQEARRCIRTQAGNIISEKSIRDAGFDVYMAGFSYKDATAASVRKVLQTPVFPPGQKVVVLNARIWKDVRSMRPGSVNPVSSTGLRSICSSLGYEYAEVAGLDPGSKPDGSPKLFRTMAAAPQFGQFLSTVRQYRDKGYKVILADTFPLPGYTFASTMGAQMLERADLSVAHLLEGGRIWNHEYAISNMMKKVVVSGRSRDIDFDRRGGDIVPIVPPSVKLVESNRPRDGKVIEGNWTAGFPITVDLTKHESRQAVRDELIDQVDLVLVFSNKGLSISRSLHDGGAGTVVSAEQQRDFRQSSKSLKRSGTFEDPYIVRKASRTGKLVELPFPDDTSLKDDWVAEVRSKIIRAVEKEIKRKHESQIYKFLSGPGVQSPGEAIPFKIAVFGSNMASIGNIEKQVVSADETTGQLSLVNIITPTGFEQSTVDNMFADALDGLFPDGKLSIKSDVVNGDFDGEIRDATVNADVQFLTSGESGIEQAVGIACQANRIPCTVELTKYAHYTNNDGTLRGAQMDISKTSFSARLSQAVNHYHAGEDAGLKVVDRRRAALQEEETKERRESERTSAEMRDAGIGLTDRMIVYLSSRIPDIEVHSLVCLSLGEPVTVEDLTEYGAKVSWDIIPEPGGCRIASAADLEQFLLDMFHQGAIGSDSVLELNEIEEGLRSTDAYIASLEAKGVHLITVRSPYYADLLRDRVTEATRVKDVMDISIDTAGMDHPYDEKEAAKVREERRGASSTSNAAEAVAEPALEPDGREGDNPRAHADPVTGKRPRIRRSAVHLSDEDVSAAHVEVSSHEETVTYLQAPPAVIPYAGDPANINSRMVYIDGVSLLGNDASDPTVRSQCQRLGRRLAGEGVTVAADIDDPAAVAVAQAASEAGGRCVYETDKAPDNPAVSDFLRMADANGDTVLFPSLNAGDEEKGPSAMEKLALHAAKKDNENYYVRSRSNAFKRSGSFFGQMSDNLVSGPDALVVFALAAKAVSVSLAAVGEVIDLFSPNFEGVVSLKADELWNKAVEDEARSIEERNRKELSDAMASQQELHPETIRFSVMRRGTEQVFILNGNYPDVCEAIRRTFGPDSRFASSSSEARELLTMAEHDGVRVAVPRNDFAPGVTQAYDEPVYAESLVYHDEEIYTVPAAPDTVPGLLPLSERKANRELLDQARTLARGIIERFNDRIGIPAGMNIQFANALYLHENPSGVYVYQGPTMVGAVTMDPAGRLKIYSGSPLAEDISEHHRRYEPVFPKTDLGFQQHSRDDNKLSKRNVEDVMELSSLQMRKMFESLGNRVLGYTDADVKRSALATREEREERRRALEEGFEDAVVSNEYVALQDLDEALPGRFQLSASGEFAIRRELEQTERELGEIASAYRSAIVRKDELPSQIGSLSDSNPKKKELEKQLKGVFATIQQAESLSAKRDELIPMLEKARQDSHELRLTTVAALSSRIMRRTAHIQEISVKVSKMEGEMNELSDMVMKESGDDIAVTALSKKKDELSSEIANLEEIIRTNREAVAADHFLMERIATASIVEAAPDDAQQKEAKEGDAPMKKETSERKEDQFRKERLRAYAVAYHQLTKIETELSRSVASIEKATAELKGVEEAIVGYVNGDPDYKDLSVEEIDAFSQRKDQLLQAIEKAKTRQTKMTRRRKDNAVLRDAILSASEISFNTEEKNGKTVTKISLDRQEKGKLKVTDVPEEIFKLASRSMDAELRQARRGRSIIIDGRTVVVPSGSRAELTPAERKRAEEEIVRLNADLQARRHAFSQLTGQVETGRSRYDATKDLKGRGGSPADAALRRLLADLRSRFPEEAARRFSPASGPVSGWDFTGLELTGIDFTGVDLSGVRFCSSTLDGCLFAGTKLSGADFSAAMIKSTDFSGADMDGADLSGATLDGCLFRKCDLSGASFNLAAVKSGDFYRTALSKASFEEGTLEGCRFENAHLDKGSFIKARISGCTFSGSVIRDCETEGAKFQENVIQFCDLTGTDIPGTVATRNVKDGKAKEPAGGKTEGSAPTDAGTARKEEVVGAPSNGVVVIERDGRFAYAEEATLRIMSPFYLKVEPFGKHYGQVVLLDGKIQWLDRSGGIIFPEPVERHFGGKENMLLVSAHGGKYNHIDMTTKRFVSETWSSYAGHFNNGWALIRASEEEKVPGKYGKYNYINKDGDLLSPRWFVSAGDFKDGTAKVSFDGEHFASLRSDESVVLYNGKGEETVMDLLSYAKSVPAVPSIVFSSYYGNMGRLPKDAFVVQISNSCPKGIHVDAKWDRVVPDWGTVDTYKKEMAQTNACGNADEADRMRTAAETKYRNSYWGKIYDQTKYIAEELGRLMKQAAGRPVFLMCYEKAGEFCHRTILSELINTEVIRQMKEGKMPVPPRKIEEAPGSVRQVSIPRPKERDDASKKKSPTPPKS